MTLAELSVGPLVARGDQERAARQAHLQQAATDFDPIPFGAAAARAFGQVAASLRRSGRKSAARNPGDFIGIDGLELVPVTHPSSATI